MDILDMAAAAGSVRSGLVPKDARQAQMMSALAGSAARRTLRPPRWTAQDERLLRRQTGRLSDEQIARQLGRTVCAVRLRRKRRGIVCPTSRYLSAREVARILAVDSKLVARWIQMDILKGCPVPVNRPWWGIARRDLIRFAVNPENWVYFNISRVTDERLARLIALRKQRWGDEWWTTDQVRDYWGAKGNLVNKWIIQGVIRSVQPYGWNNDHYIRRSDAITYDFLGVRGKGNRNGLDWSEPADAFLLLATAAGAPPLEIAGMTRYPPVRVYARLSTLLSREQQARALIARYDLPVQYAAGKVFADWRNPVCRQRLPQLAAAIDRFLAGKSVNSRQLSLARGVLYAWVNWQCASDPALRDTARRLRYGHAAPPEMVRETCRQLQAAGVFPLEGTCSD